MNLKEPVTTLQFVWLPKVSCKKKVFLELSQNSQENTCARASFSIKETLVQVFSCEFCKISKNSFLREHFRATASEKYQFHIKIYTLAYHYSLMGMDHEDLDLIIRRDEDLMMMKIR